MVHVVSEKRWEKWERMILFLFVLACYTYTFPRWADPNQNSRLDMVVALVEDGTLQIDKYVANTVDYARFEGHYYSDKAPGAAFLGVPVYAVLRIILDLPLVEGLTDRLANSGAFQATLREDGSGVSLHKVRFALAQVVLAFTISALPSALLSLLLFRILTRFTTRLWPRISVALGYALLTPAFAYAGAFYGHQLSAACLFGAFYLLFAQQRPLSSRTLLIAGLLMGYSVITEYPSALIAGILSFYALYRLNRRRRIGWVILGGSLMAAVLMAYNTAVYHSPWELGYHYSELWAEKHQAGLMSLTWPHWEALWGITFSPFRGLFVLSPWLLLSAPGFVLWWRSGEHRPELLVCLISVLAFLWFNASSIMWWGGYAVGPRYLLPSLPFMALPTVYAFRGWRWRGIGAVITALAAWSFVATWGLTLAGQAFPPDTIRNPLIEYAWPHLTRGNLARNAGTVLGLAGWWSLAPLAVTLALIGLAWWCLRHQHGVRCSPLGVGAASPSGQPLARRATTGASWDRERDR